VRDVVGARAWGKELGASPHGLPTMKRAQKAKKASASAKSHSDAVAEEGPRSPEKVREPHRPRSRRRLSTGPRSREYCGAS
jgi:hypothetical protein